MAEKKKKRKKPAKKERRERRFLPEQTHMSRFAAGLGIVGSAVLGAGVYGQWIREQPFEFAPYLVAAGAFALAGGLWLGSTGVYPVRIGDAGLAIERGAETIRVPWCDIENIRVDKADLVVRAKHTTLTIPLGAHPKATALVVQEAERRIAGIVDIPDAARRALGTVKDSDGESVTIEGLQIAGARCAESHQIISFERDARLCPNCGQVYHKSHVPKKCVTCDRDLGEKAEAA